MGNHDNKIAVITYARWTSDTFTGAKVIMTGTPFEADSDIEIASGWVADIHRRSPDEVELLIIRRGDGNADDDEQVVTGELCAAAQEHQQLVGVQS